MRCIIALVIGVLALNNVAGFSSGRNYGSDEIPSNQVISARFKRQSDEASPVDGQAPTAEEVPAEAPLAEGEAPPSMDELQKKAEEIGNKVKSLWGFLVKGVTDLVDTVSSSVG